MELRIDASRARTVPLDAVIPAGAAARAALAGNSYLLEELVVSSLLRESMRQMRDERKARALVADALKSTSIRVEFDG